MTKGVDITMYAACSLASRCIYVGVVPADFVGTMLWFLFHDRRVVCAMVHVD